MNSTPMSSMQRFLTVLTNGKPDRVPLFLFLTMHGARDLGLSIKNYFSRAEYVAEGQSRMYVRYGHDCLYVFYYAAIELEAWGGEVIFSDNGPAVSGGPVLKGADAIKNINPPRVQDSKQFLKVIETIRILKSKFGTTVPIIGVVISPFSLPVMQIGFSSYLELIYGQPELFNLLMQMNEQFSVDWANTQLNAGATALIYFDPVSSPTIIPRNLYLDTGFKIAQRTLSRIKGPTITHFASGNCAPILDLVSQTGTAGVGVGSEEDLTKIKTSSRNLLITGNLNGIAMRNWTSSETENEVKKAIMKAGTGGGFILADSHGEIPWQVDESTLSDIKMAVEKWGYYPLSWTKQ